MRYTAEAELNQGTADLICFGEWTEDCKGPLFISQGALKTKGCCLISRQCGSHLNMMCTQGHYLVMIDECCACWVKMCEKLECQEP